MLVAGSVGNSFRLLLKWKVAGIQCQMLSMEDITKLFMMSNRRTYALGKDAFLQKSTSNIIGEGCKNYKNC